MIEPGDCFGTVDMTMNIEKILEYENAQNRFMRLDDEMMELRFQQKLWFWDFTGQRSYRNFSIQVVKEASAEYYYLSLMQLNTLRSEFPELYRDLFIQAKYELNVTKRAKQRGLELLDEIDPVLRSYSMIRDKKGKPKFKLSQSRANRLLDKKLAKRLSNGHISNKSFKESLASRLKVHEDSSSVD